SNIHARRYSHVHNGKQPNAHEQHNTIQFD
ncbi:unnamed protein product, partial [Rotaria sp. Silwood1]